MKTMSRFKHYLYANLYLLLPVLLLMGLLPALTPTLTDLVRPSVLRSYSACDYGSGGSLNLCENEVWWRGLLLAVGVSTILAWLVPRILIWLLGIHWLSPLYGVGFFYGASGGMLCFNVIFSSIFYSDQPGANETLLAWHNIIVGCLALAVSWFSFKRYLQKDVPLTATGTPAYRSCAGWRRRTRRRPHPPA